MTQLIFGVNGAKERLKRFLILREGKPITEKTIKDFDLLLKKMDWSFKHSYYEAIPPDDLKNFEASKTALSIIKKGVMTFEGHCLTFRICDIKNFQYNSKTDITCTVDNVKYSITEKDYLVLKKIFL